MANDKDMKGVNFEKTKNAGPPRCPRYKILQREYC